MRTCMRQSGATISAGATADQEQVSGGSTVQGQKISAHTHGFQGMHHHVKLPKLSISNLVSFSVLVLSPVREVGIDFF